MKLWFSTCMAASVLAVSAQAQESVEVLHFWTSPGEAAALNVIKADLARQGVAWKDMAVSNPTPDGTYEELRKRVVTHDPPTAAVLFTTEIREWARLGALADLNAVAAREGWDKVIPPMLQEGSKYQGRWVAVPINLQVFNSIYANKAVLDQAGVKQMPTTWDEMIAAMDKVKAKGITPFAMPGQGWIINIAFESVVVATGGAAFHRQAFTQHDPAALGSPTMVKAFDRLGQLRRYTDDAYLKREWSDAVAQVVQGKAAFVIMGAWAKGEFTAAGKEAGRDFYCTRAPGTQDMMLYASDQFAMFSLGSGGIQRATTPEAQARMAASTLSPRVQSAFNIAKGSIPVRTDVPDTGFDACARAEMKALPGVAKAGKLMSPMSQVTPATMKRLIYEVVERRFAGKLTSAEAARAMAAASEQ